MTIRSVPVRSVRWKAWEGSQYRSEGRSFWVICPFRPYIGGSETEAQVESYLSGADDKQRGLRPEFNYADYMAGYRGDPTYAKGVIDAVTGAPRCSENPSYVAGYTYQPRPKRSP